MAHARGESETHDINDDETSDCTVEPERNCGSCRALWYRLDAASSRRARHARTASRLPKRRHAAVRTVCPGRPADHDLHGPDAALRQSALSRADGKGEEKQPGALSRSDDVPPHPGYREAQIHRSRPQREVTSAWMELPSDGEAAEFPYDCSFTLRYRWSLTRRTGGSVG